MTHEYPANDFFGPLDDIEIQKDLRDSLHVQLRFEDRMKYGDRSTGKCVLVAPKGYGKTHFRMLIDGHVRDQDIVVGFNERENVFDLDASEISIKSGRASHLIQFYILTKVASIIEEQGGFDWKDFGGILSSTFKKIKTAAKSVSKVEISVAGATISLDKLFSSQSNAIVNNSLNSLVERFINTIGSRRVYIQIDDLEEVFNRIEENPVFIEGLVRAVSDINKRTGNKIHVLLCMKLGLWKILSEGRREYDKVRDQFEFLDWNEYQYKQMLAKRISVFHVDKVKNAITDVEEKSLYRVWLLFFNLGDMKSWNQRVAELVSLCRNGPRDFIFLCNLAAANMEGKKISWANFERVMDDFSTEKFSDVCAEYRDIYPDLDLFAKYVLDDSEASFEFDILKERIANISGNNNIMDALGKHQWFSVKGTNDRIKVLYDTGILGIKRKDRIVYSMEERIISLRELKSSILVVHPALRSYLGVV
ncbi:hypothetical protein [Nitratireductor sp. XY-223]|uniref:P-loop ATPase, Sll1717 family n=1 Tax=Nitratireductor sp. XY-223 TaxID=2561926 RepID=UPI0010AB2527|nr:hypothetical protein [Nitratireductor sp. XY-223]